MNIETLQVKTIQHEFGHAIGLLHEHQHPNRDFEFDPEAILADLSKVGWNATDVQYNILDKKPLQLVCAGQGVNAASVMNYDIKPEWLKSGSVPKRTGTVTELDLQCAKWVYS
jgi:hypothetical protein